MLFDKLIAKHKELVELKREELRLASEINKEYSDALASKKEELRISKIILNENLKETYFQRLLDKACSDAGIDLEIKLSLNDGHDNIFISRTDKQAIKREGFWDKYNKAQAALGNK